jgi:O-antigen ligase
LETADGFKMALYTALFLFISYGILLGFSRGSWINYVVSAVLYTGFRFRTYQNAAEINRLLKILGLVLLLFVVFIIYITSTDKISDMLEVRFHVQHYDTMHGGRLSNQLLILKTALAHPLGVGAYLSEILFFRAPHNIYLHVLIESGWIGAIAFYSFLIVTLQKAYKFCLQPSSIQRSYAVVFVCTIGILVQSFFIDSTHWRHMYMLFAMLWGPALFWQDQVKVVRDVKYQSMAVT